MGSRHVNTSQTPKGRPAERHHKGKRVRYVRSLKALEREIHKEQAHE